MRLRARPHIPPLSSASAARIPGTPPPHGRPGAPIRYQACVRAKPLCLTLRSDGRRGSRLRLSSRGPALAPEDVAGPRRRPATLYSTTRGREQAPPLRPERHSSSPDRRAEPTQAPSPPRVHTARTLGAVPHMHTRIAHLPPAHAGGPTADRRTVSTASMCASVHTHHDTDSGSWRRSTNPRARVGGSGKVRRLRPASRPAGPLSPASMGSLLPACLWSRKKRAGKNVR
jgi:hypothetical protein